MGKIQSGTAGVSENSAAAAPQWFVAYTVTRHEKAVADHFSQRTIESFLPSYKSPRMWKNGCKVNVELPLFPSYIFVRISREQRVRVLEVPGVLSLVCSGGKPVPLPELEIEALRSAVPALSCEPHPYLVVGERVRVKSGPLMGMEGVLLRKKNYFRIVLSLHLITQSVAVEVDADNVEPAANGAMRRSL